MPSSPNNIPHVALAEPAQKSLCSPLFYALMLSTLRRRFPRVHYEFPNFATFCRGEALEGPALTGLALEIEQILLGIEDLAPSDIFRLADGEDPEDPEIYRQAHYRGRTFDRTRVREVEHDEAPGTPPETPTTRYGGLLRSIQEQARRAHKSAGKLSQERRAYHRPLGPVGFQED